MFDCTISVLTVGLGVERNVGVGVVRGAEQNVEVGVQVEWGECVYSF